MKDNRFPNRIFTIFGVALFCIFVLALTSCENFLKGANVRSELAEAIEIANTNPVTYYVIADQGSGTVNPSQLRLKKKESFDIMFVPNDEWKFICWEVLDRDTDEVVENCISFKDATALETRGTILTSRENLYIHPKCIKLPAVISHTPSNNTEKNYANTPVIIDFNMELDEENFAEGGVFSNYDFITITFSSSPISDLFEKPVLSDNKASITLTPKADVLAKYIKEEKKAAYIDVVFGFKEETNILIGGQSTPMVSSQSFSVRFLPTTETDPPEEVEFYACRPDDKDKKYYIEKDILDDSDKIKQNRSKGKVYIYGKYSDEESGVKYVEVKEKQKSDNWEKLVEGTVYSKKYTSETLGATFITNGSNTEFFIEYELQSGTGAIQMDVTVYDSCMNAATVKSFTVIKVSSDNYYFTTGTTTYMELFSVYNYPGRNYVYCFEDGSYFDIDDYNNYHKTLYITDSSDTIDTDIYPLIETIYGASNRLTKEDFTIVCEYVDDSGDLVPGTFVPSGNNNYPYSYWSCPLQNVAKVSGLEVLVRVTDDIGNYAEQTVKFLPEPTIILTEENENITPIIYYDNLDTSADVWCIKTNTLTNEKTYSLWCPTTLEENYSYQVIPQANNLVGEIASTSFTKNTAIGNSTPIQWAADPEYSLGTQNEQLLATIKIAADSWDNHDSIYCHVTKKVNTNTSPIGDFWFPKNQSIMGIPINTVTAYTHDITFTLYGINGNAKSAASDPKPITNLNTTDTLFKLDNSCPTATLTPHSSDKIGFLMSDTGSGPFSASIKKSDGKEFVFADKDTGFINPVDAWIFNEYGSTVILRDKNENTTIQSFNLPAPSEIAITSITLELKGWKLNVTGSINGYSFDYYEWNDGDWGVKNNQTNNYEWKISNKFLKIEPHSSNTDGLGRRYWGTPQYFYFGQQNSGQFDYIEPFNDESVFVTSDAPAYVETIITTKPYDECKNWTTEEWERYHRNEKGEYFPFEASANPTRRKYNIPLDLINPGECYIIIAHFADGTSFKTEVRQK